MEVKKVEVRMNKPIYLRQAILDISKTLMYGFWYNYIKPKYGDKARLCYIDTDSFVMHIKTKDFYKDVAGDVERWFDTYNYGEKDKRPPPIGKDKKVIGMLKDELGGKIMTEFFALRAKAYAFKLDDDTEKEKAKGTKKCILKREITFKNYTAFPYGTNAFKVCENEMLSRNKSQILRNESQILRSESWILRNKSQILGVNHKHLEVNHEYLQMN